MEDEKGVLDGQSKWAVKITLGMEFEECLELSWDVVPKGGYDASSPPEHRHSVVELVIDHSKPGDRVQRNLEPPKGAMVKRVEQGRDTEACILNMPVGRKFLIAVIVTLTDNAKVRSHWVRACTLSPSTRDTSLQNLDPYSTPRLGCQRCPCPGYVPIPGWSWNTPKKLRCRRCSCQFSDHDAVDSYKILKAREKEVAEKLKPSQTTVALPEDAVQWEHRECVLWIATDGLFHPRKTVGEHQPQPSLDVQARPGGPEGIAGKKGRVSVIVPTVESRHAFHKSLWACFQAQAWPDKELVVVETYNDKHSDVFADLAKKHSNLVYSKYKRKPGQDMSIGLKRNIACALATGEFIAHFDDDDLYSANYLTIMITHLERQQAGAITLSSWFTYDVERCAWGFCDAVVWGWSKEKKQQHQDVKAWTYGYGFSYVYRRRVAMEMPYADMNMGEDFNFVKELQSRKGEMTVALFRDDFGMCLHLQHGQNTSNSFPIREISSEEAWRLEVAKLPANVNTHLRSFSARPQEGRFATLHYADGVIQVPCAAGMTAGEFLTGLRAVPGHTLPKDDLVLYCVPPEGWASDEERDAVAAKILALPPRPIGVIEIEDDVFRERNRAITEAKTAMKMTDRISLFATHLWVLHLRSNEKTREEQNGIERLPGAYTVVAVTCQKSKIKKFANVQDAIRVRVPVGSTVAGLRYVMRSVLPENAKVLAECRDEGFVPLKDTEPLPEKVTISDFSGRDTFYAHFSDQDCMVSLGMMKEFWEKPQNKSRLDALVNECADNWSMYGVKLTDILVKEVYPAILRTFDLPGDKTGGARMILSCMTLTDRFESLPTGASERCEKLKLAKLWHEMEIMVHSPVMADYSLKVLERLSRAS